MQPTNICLGCQPLGNIYPIWPFFGGWGNKKDKNTEFIFKILASNRVFLFWKIVAANICCRQVSKTEKSSQFEAFGTKNSSNATHRLFSKYLTIKIDDNQFRYGSGKLFVSESQVLKTSEFPQKKVCSLVIQSKLKHPNSKKSDWTQKFQYFGFLQARKFGISVNKSRIKIWDFIK